MEWKRFALAMMGHFLASLLYVLRRLRLINAVVDTSSILEHREEIRELWETRMMADENQSSPSSTTAAEATSTKPVTEEGKEEVVATTNNSESETKPDHKLPNGSAKLIENDSIEDSNANPIQEPEASEKTVDSEPSAQKVEIDHDNNNCADSLEGDNTDDYVEEKTYTSETSLVIKSESVEVTEEIIVQTTTEEHVPEDIVKQEVAMDTNETTVSATAEVEDNVDGVSSVEETIVTATVEKVSSEEVSETDAVTDAKLVEVEDSKIEEVHAKEATEEKGIKALEIPDCADEDGDGFVRIEECLPIGDDIEGTEHEILTEEQRNGVSNGHEEPQPPGTPSLPPTPDSALGDKLPTQPDIEHFVKSGGLKRVLPGVQKTEQPYSTCTTETKIAMEIREMREREEELRVMREQALLSPVPPKSPTRSPSPCLTTKESSVPNGGPSPVPNAGLSPVPNGCGYRVSSVFSHKGSTSPSPSVIAEEEKLKGGLVKGFAKESAVEKEIRLARDREEELRKQKGLPPREDDSYVKPSQVKSSQVRVFGKAAGGNNVKQAATAKIQLEIEEQTQRELALRDTGSIQTISQERTDAKVAKLKTPEVIKPVNGQNGNSHPALPNGNHTNGRSSPDVAPYKRTTPSPNGGSFQQRPHTIFSNGGTKANGVSMHKFIASKGKESTFVAPVVNKNGVKEEGNNNRANVPPTMIKLKRTVSVESKIQQEIMEMKQREEELKLLHLNRSNENSLLDEDIMEHEMNQKNNFLEFENGNGVHDEDISPRHNKLIAQWEQRIQKAES